MRADSARMQIGMTPPGGFSPVFIGEKGAGQVGPGSNTGQKGQQTAIIDFLTLVMPASSLEDFRCTNIELLIYKLFGFRGEVIAGPIREKNWNFYPQSAVLKDREGELVGRIGLGGNKETVCVSISGAGCKWVKDWRRTYLAATQLKAKISRVDCAHDDFDGKRLDVHALRRVAAEGGFAEGGCPPRHRFMSDEGHGTGNTLYVGGKGHKELCVYEKGKQLGLSSSPWVRAEVRLYGKHVEVPLDVLLDPGAYLRGAYSVLRDLIKGVCSRLRTIRKQVDVSVEAGVEWAHRQVGPFLNVLRGAFGPSWADVAEARILRDGHPGRFRGIAKGDALHKYVREGLCQFAA